MYSGDTSSSNTQYELNLKFNADRGNPQRLSVEREWSTGPH